jgi:hypothetical protein
MVDIQICGNVLVERSETFPLKRAPSGLPFICGKMLPTDKSVSTPECNLLCHTQLAALHTGRALFSIPRLSADTYEQSSNVRLRIVFPTAAKPLRSHLPACHISFMVFSC